ncbi:hypothetical protein AALP_AAs69437U000100, partial [Arabis alpina]
MLVRLKLGGGNVEFTINGIKDVFLPKLNFLYLLDDIVFEETGVKGVHYKDTKRCEDETYRFNDTNKCRDEDGDGCVCKPWEGTPIGLSSGPVKTLK